MKTVYILFDFDKEQLYRDSQTSGGPPSEVDKVKVATLCELSWIRNNWKVQRIKIDRDNYWKRFSPVLGDYHWLNNWWFKTEQYETNEPQLFITADIFNNDYSPITFPLHAASLHKNFSCAAIYLKRGDSLKIRKALNAWNPSVNFTEMMVNEYLKAQCLNFMSYAYAEPNWQIYPLIHLTRSSMQWAI